MMMEMGPVSEMSTPLNKLTRLSDPENCIKRYGYLCADTKADGREEIWLPIFLTSMLGGDD
jgi:hypothetical protein